MSTPGPGGVGPYQAPPTANWRRRRRRSPGRLRAFGRLGAIVGCAAFCALVAVESWQERSSTAEEPIGRYARRLVPGDCFDTHSGIFGLNPSVEEVDCAGPHAGEMFGVWWTDEASGEVYPGREALGDHAVRACMSESYLYAGWEEHPKVKVVYGTPSEAAWSEGARNGGCYFLVKKGKVSGSLRQGGGSEAV